MGNWGEFANDEMSEVGNRRFYIIGSKTKLFILITVIVVPK